MKRIIGSMKGGSGSGADKASSRSSPKMNLPEGDSPEAVIVREVTAFCESGGPDSQNAGDEYLHLPAIVDAAESSPAAAKEAANTIRKYLSKDNYQRGYAQYNAIMLTRILTDNPARAFTQNFDSKFIQTVKELLRVGKDMSVQQILRETLDYFESDKLKSNDSLAPLVEMWKKETAKTNTRLYGNAAGPRAMRAPPPGQAKNYYANPNQRQKGLPAPEELAARIEEAKTTARLLLQTLQSTPTGELLANDLVREFADRAKAAQRSIQGYMNSDNPQPDEDTMITLIETSDKLNIAMSKHQRSVLAARKAAGQGMPSPQPQAQPGQNPYSAPSEYVPPPGPPPGAMGAVRSQDYAYSSPPPVPQRVRPVTNNAATTTQNSEYGAAENPFSDEAAHKPPPQQKQFSLFDQSQITPPTAQTQRLSAPTNPGYQTTPSYLDRQESAANNLTMHGASPVSAVSEEAPIDGDANALDRRMENMRV